MTAATGWRLVPVEATEEMCRSFYETQFSPDDTPAGGLTRWATWEEARQFRAVQIQAGFRAMLSAAPQPGVTAEEVAHLIDPAAFVLDGRVHPQHYASRRAKAIKRAHAVISLISSNPTQKEQGA